ncbi:endonuclease/exonuclease/phosphatase family protein [Knoellia sp. CPCC 206450]|uniref:endonuclease/exonuclease/phosphatase family protein n=1 Tax=Knoellia tibetensis TaxID=3404798 RepID=UPI003B43260E
MATLKQAIPADGHEIPAIPMTLGTWNLDAQQPLGRRADQRSWLARHADIWMLSEVHTMALPDAMHRTLSEPVEGMNRIHWAGITSTWPLEPIATEHPTLALARVHAPAEEVLVAASLLPWRSAGPLWPSGEGTFRERFSATLQQHQAAVGENTSAGDLVVWGGDFNQALAGDETAGTLDGRIELAAAFASLGLRSITERNPAFGSRGLSIDHIAVSTASRCRSSSCEVYGPDGTGLSDHPVYLAQVGANL